MGWNDAFRPGEAQAVTSEVLRFIDPNHMNGIDIGSSGNPITPQTISMDQGRGFLGPLIQVHGDARSLHLFKDGVLDYVFSSHCWEDFAPEEKPGVLAEWIRVLKVGGPLMLLLPDEKRYRASCDRAGMMSNPNHKDVNFSMEKTRSIIQSDVRLRDHLKEIYSIPSVGEYSFFLVYTKI